MVDIATAAREAGTIRKATADELPQLARALVEAFLDDPPTAWVFGEPRERRREALEKSFALFLRRFWLPQGETYTTGGVAGVAAWERPNEWKLSIGAQLRVTPALARINGRHLPRIGMALARLEAGHPKRPHYYLPFVGVVADYQGRGLGTALMRPVLERCDREGVPAYLEASTPRNRALYERLGFATTEEFHVGKGSPPAWRMWREPAAPENRTLT